MDSIFFNSSRSLSKAYTLYGLSNKHTVVVLRLLYFVHWVTAMINFGFQNGSSMDGCALQSGISEWKCIPEWNIYVELNGPYAWASV